MPLNIEYIISKVIKKMHFRAIKDSNIHNTSSIGAGSSFIESTMDRNSFCGYDCTIIKCDIGSFTSIAGNCEIGGANHTMDWVSTSPVFNENKDQIRKKYSYHKFDYNKLTVIGNDVWIGAKCLIKAGVVIGDGAVIGMGSVVTKDVPPYEVWAGNPARLIRKRFDESKINELKNTQWWNFSDEKLKELSMYITDIEKFLEKKNDKK